MQSYNFKFYKMVTPGAHQKFNFNLYQTFVRMRKMKATK